jgi:hypothetical protein
MGQKISPQNAKRKAEVEARKKMTPKQIRARARRRGGMDQLSATEQKAMLGKHIEEWDLEELARGRPRDKNGHFTGVAPKWITREMHEKSIELFKTMIRTDMQSHTVLAMDTIKELLQSEEVDDKGKPTVPAGVKADLSKFLIEHLIGKPTQPIEGDINLKLQGILGAVLVQPEQLSAGRYQLSAGHRVLEGEIVEDEEEDEDA